METIDMSQMGMPVNEQRLQEFNRILNEYKAGIQPTKNRIISAENWWKLRNTTEESRVSNIGKDGAFTSRSGWLHNVIVSKHADAVEAYPEPNILPREISDRPEARKLTAIVPCILEQNGFERVYSDAMWQKMKTGTACYKIIWDSSRLNGLGDIAIERVNLLNIYWEPGVDDIQKSRYLFHTELVDKELLQKLYPEHREHLKGQSFYSSRFLYDDHVKTEDKLTVVEVYYHGYEGGRKILHYCKYVNDVVLYASENDPELAQRGLYDHGMYPYEFDPLFPVEGSPCGYGFVDVCMNPQTEIDLIKTAFVKNAQVGATPRYFSRGDGAVNEEEFLDLSKPIVHVNNASEDALKQIGFNGLDGVYVNVLDMTITELRETSGNTETSTGSTSAGVTAASAIAALQEASGKGSRDATKAAYRSFERIVGMVIELIRQFYDLPRSFRILGQYGAEQYISYTNRGLKAQNQGMAFGQDMGFRLPVFDIKVSAQKKNVYTKVSQNELALQFFQLGFFNPQMTDQALMCLEMMDFDGKDEIMQQISRMGTMQQKLVQYMQMALMLAQKHEPALVQGLSQDVAMSLGVNPAVSAEGASPAQADPVTGLQKEEHAFVEKSREQAAQASQPQETGAVKEDRK